MAQRLVEETKVTKRTLNRWKQTFSDLCLYEWDNLERHYCGEAMLMTTALANEDAFRINNIFKMGRTVKHVRMDDDFRIRFNDMHHMMARSQVNKKPMITKPLRWERTPEG